MKMEALQQNELKQSVRLKPSLEAPRAAWCSAQHRFQNEPVKQNQDVYNAAIDELGQSISHWQYEHSKKGVCSRYRFRTYPSMN
jgi:hypothetical protein